MSESARIYAGSCRQGMPRWPRSPVRNCVKLLGIIFLSPIAFACSGAPLPVAESAELQRLRTDNARLERELTEIRENALVDEEKSACRPVSSGEEKVKAPPLPVVQLRPEEDPQEQEGEVSFEVKSSPGVPFAPPEEHSAATRPVLKVRGEHEAWVYHRPLESKERTASVPKKKSTAPLASTPTSPSPLSR